eukprot:gene8954-16588_t
MRDRTGFIWSFVFANAVLLLFVTVSIKKNPSYTQPKNKKVYNLPEKGCKTPIEPKKSGLFADILLSVNFNHPFYSNIKILRRYLEPIFPNIIFCGPEEHSEGGIDVIKIDQRKEEYGFYGYQCLVEGIKRQPGFEGYLLINDDMIINWWNLLQLDKKKIWFGDTKPKPEDCFVMGSQPDEWFSRYARGHLCERLYKSMEKNAAFNTTNMFEIFLENTGRQKVCLAALSDIFYVPAAHAERFTKIAQYFYDNRLFLEIAVPMALYFLDSKSNIIPMNGLYLQKKYGWSSSWKYRTVKAWKEYNYDMTFLHPYKFSASERNVIEFETKVGNISRRIIAEGCLDFFKNNTHSGSGM